MSDQFHCKICGWVGDPQKCEVHLYEHTLACPHQIKPEYLPIVLSVEAEIARIDAEISELRLLRDEALEASHDYSQYLDGREAAAEPLTIRQYYQVRTEFEKRQDLVEEACESDDRGFLCDMVLAHGPRIEELRAMLEGWANYG